MFLWQRYASSPTLQHKIALRDEQGNAFTWQQIADHINQLAFSLQQQGVSSQSGVALYCKNSLPALLLYLATIQLGARVMGVNPAFPVDKMQQLCQLYQIQFYYAPQLDKPRDKISQNLTALFVDFGDKSASVDLFVTWDQARPATMTLTSGSTGTPKAVVHSVQAHLDNARGVCQLMQFSAENSWLLSLPLYHVSVKGIVCRWLSVGAQLYLPQSDFYYSVTQASHISLVPTQLQRFLHYLQAQQINHFKTRHILLGGSKIPLNLTQTLVPLKIKSYSGYGMSGKASTAFAKVSDLRQGVGQPLLGREWKIVNDEIWLRGAGLALGYWQQGDVVSLLNEQGWFATKDKGCWQDNELVVLGRMDNMFISGGENIQPEEVEQVILAHENIEQAFVLPMDDAEFGQRPVAMIKFKEPFSQSAVKNLADWLSGRLERFKQPVKYFPLNVENSQQGIKISRHLLKNELHKLLGK